MIQNEKEILNKTPRTSGVYLFRDSEHNVLYVGKATRLRDRLRQYFSGKDTRGERIVQLMDCTHTVDTIETDTTIEALILESSLIKKYNPQFNVEGKDDKSFSYFLITKEYFSRVLIVRQSDLYKEKYQATQYKNGKIFGPYTSKDHMYIALKIIRKIFPFHDKSEKTEKGCLHFQIGLCPGPYAHMITHEEYRKNIRNISLFLSGRKKSLIKTLTKEMHDFAQKEAFELAQKRKLQLYAVQHINDVALMKKQNKIMNLQKNTMRIEAYDISHIGGKYMVASMIVFVDGQSDRSQYRKFKIKTVKGIDDIAAMREVLLRRIHHFDEWPVPNMIVLDGGKGHINMADELWREYNISIPIIAVAKGPTRKKVDIYKSKWAAVHDSVINDRDLIESLREEAHRFAIQYHRILRKKSYYN